MCARASLHRTAPGQMNLVFVRGWRQRTLKVLPGVIHGISGRDLFRPDSSRIELPKVILTMLMTTGSACTRFECARAGTAVPRRADCARTHDPLTCRLLVESEHSQNQHMLMIADDCLSFHAPQTSVFERGKLRPPSQAHSAKACG
jgi:hypothetical protein